MLGLLNTELNLDLAIGGIADSLTGTLFDSDGAIQKLVDALDTGLVDPAVEGLLDGDNAVGIALTDLLSITINNQELSDGTFTETALRVSVLGGSGAVINLAQASVGPNVTSVEDPCIVDCGVGGETTTPTGVRRRVARDDRGEHRPADRDDSRTAGSGCLSGARELPEPPRGRFDRVTPVAREAGTVCPSDKTVPASFCLTGQRGPGGTSGHWPVRRLGVARISKRIGSIAESATLKVDAKAKALKAEGRPVISYRRRRARLPDPRAHRRGRRRRRPRPQEPPYTPAAGLPELREAIAAKTLRDSALEVDPSQVIVTNGGKQAVYQAFATLLDPGDEVLLPAPYWTTYPEAIKLAGGVPVEVFAGADQDYLVTVEQLEAARTPRTKVLLFVSPSNPTGAVYSPEQTAAIGEWAEENGLWVISDEIYQNLTYDGQRAVSIVEAVPALADRTILVNGVAKTYAMTGWRVGWMVGPADAIKAAGNLQSHLSLERVEHLAARGDRGAHRAAGCGRDDAPGVRPPAQAHRRAGSKPSTGSSARCPRARSTCTRTSPGCSGASGAASRRRRRWSSPTSSWIRPRSRRFRARRSGRAGTCASATRSATRHRRGRRAAAEAVRRSPAGLDRRAGDPRVTRGR